MQPLLMWAVIVKNPRSEWIWYPSIQRTRREALKIYQDGYTDPEQTKKELKAKRIRVARLRISVLPS